MRITGQEKTVWGRRATATAVLAVVVGALLPGRAEAIPAFARKYQFSCSTCHAPVPRLKPFGEAFAARGFRLEDPAQEPPRATHDTGDPTLRLMRELPLAFRLDGYASWKENEAAETDTEFPWAFKILSGGQIHERISYYMYFILEKGGVQGLEDAWLQFNTPLNLPINVTVGQFQVCDPLFKREARLERYDYEIFGTRVGASPISLTYDRGVIASWSFPGAVDTVVQVVNGNGIHEADEAGNFDEDGLKNVSLRLARTFNRVRLGAFSYWGKTTGIEGDNRTYYIGPDAVISFSDRVQLNLQYLERRRCSLRRAAPNGRPAAGLRSSCSCRAARTASTPSPVSTTRWTRTIWRPAAKPSRPRSATCSRATSASSSRPAATSSVAQPA